jgi:hypothetical protein
VIGRVPGRGGFGVTYLATDALYPDIKAAIRSSRPRGWPCAGRATFLSNPAAPAAGAIAPKLQ